jgi:glucose/arabinose dehydrogenase
MHTSVRVLRTIVVATAAALVTTATAATSLPGDAGHASLDARLDPQPVFLGTGAAPLDNIEIELVPVASGFSRPIFLTSRVGDDRRFIAEQAGLVYSIDPDGGNRTEVLDVSDLTGRDGNEQGLLGMTFHPTQPERMFVSYTHVDTGDSVIAEYDFPLASAAAATTATEVVLEVDQPAGNHNGGMMAFGPDGMLYISMGDGGGSGDPNDNGQDPSTLLGSILRIDLDSLPYLIPADNPFADEEVWAYGLRNPWRFSFDGNDLYIGDVGQGRQEEVNLVDVTEAAGTNFGWNTMEGTLCYPSGNPCDGDDFGALDPIHTYSIAGEDNPRCAITGGYVYRGPSGPGLQGAYVFADYCSGQLMALRTEAGAVTEARDFPVTSGNVSSFGTDNDGRLYVVNLSGGTVSEVTATTIAFTDVPSGHLFYDEIQWLVDNGITTGFSDGTFRPGANVARQAIAAFLYRLEDVEGYVPPAEPTFTDVGTTHPFYTEVEWLVEEGIANGFTDGTFRPGTRVTRQAVAAFLSRLPAPVV